MGVEVEPFASHATGGCIRPCPHLHSGVFWRFVGGRGSPAAHSRPTEYFFRLPCAPTKYRPPPWRGSGNYVVCDGETGSGKVTSDGAVGRVTRLDRVYLIWILPYGVFTKQPNVVYERLEKISAEWVPEYSTYKVPMHIKVKYCFTLVRL